MLLALLIIISCFVYYVLKGIEKHENNQKQLEIQINSLTDKETQMPISNNPAIDVHIKENQVDASRIVEYTGEAIKKFEFRPETWEQFISQENAKEEIKTVIKKVKRGIRGHLILSALKGSGKTTFIELFAHSIGAKLIERIGRQIDEDNIVDIVNE